jgi:5-methylcytosine-specific restriction protein A
VPTAPPKHRPFAAPERQPNRERDKKRGSACKRLYGAKWRKARDAWLKECPLCVECEKRGRLVDATDVDHIVPHRGNKAIFWDYDNWQSLCGTCHKRKTGRGE